MLERTQSQPALRFRITEVIIPADLSFVSVGAVAGPEESRAETFNRGKAFLWKWKNGAPEVFRDRPPILIHHTTRDQQNE